MTAWVSAFIVVLGFVFLWMLPDQQNQSIYIPTKKQEKDQPVEKKQKISQTIKLMEISLPPPPPVKELREFKSPWEGRQAPANPSMQTISFLKAQPKRLPKSRPIKTQDIVKEIQPMKPETKQLKVSSVSDSVAATVPSTNETTISANPKKIVAEGRSLLRLLEHGEGPSMEISWPNSPASRRTLYNLFKKCYGMRIAVVDRKGNVFKGRSRRGRAWPVNQDLYSGFVRQSSSGEIWDEQLTARHIRNHHGLENAVTVRLFPRQVDAFLLGGFKALVGNNYGEAKHIQADYWVSGWRVFVGNITIDSRPVRGRVDLSGGAIRGCRI